MKKVPMIELLAPAKNKVCAKAAIDFGADAIYIGASEFGARKNVPNSLEDIKEIVEYSHKFNAKVYVTINTILTDDEILKAKKLVEDLYQINVDAIIVQDMGFFELELPPIQLFASTQCDNRTAEKVKFLENAGASRVILARELSIEQIEEIKAATNVDLETFVHGALCVSYSGQCYLSHLIGGRSANRGECAQPCRKKYSLVDANGKVIAKDQHLLNLKDFNAAKHLKQLADAGITSFKIEGRLKDENYVKNVVGFYRKLIDELGLGKTSSGEVIFDFEPTLEKSFNRGFTDYFLEERKDCYSILSPKSMGEYIGNVKKISGNYFEVKMADSHTAAASQDGLCFYSKEELSGCLVNRVDEVKEFPIPFNAVDQSPNIRQTIYPNKMDGIAVGTEIYRNVDCEFEKTLKNSKTCRKITADIIFDIKSIKIIDEDKNSAEISYKFEEFAQNEEKMKENIQNQLKKSGESDFLIKNVEIKTDKIPFLPISKINELRRELLEKLTDERLKNYKKIICNRKDEKTDYPQAEIDFHGNVLNKYAKDFYEKHGCKVTEMALESEVSKGFTVSSKKAMTTKHCLKYAFGMCVKETKDEGKKLYLIDEKYKKYPLKFDCKNCQMEIYFGEDLKEEK